MEQNSYSAPYRRIDAEVYISYGDEYFRDSVSDKINEMNFTNTNELSLKNESDINPAAIYAEGNAPEYKVFTLDNYPLSAGHGLIDPIAAGWWSKVRSTANGDAQSGYAFPDGKLPALTITFDKIKPLRSWEIEAEGIADEYPVLISLALFNSNGLKVYGQDDLFCGKPYTKFDLLDDENPINNSGKTMNSGLTSNGKVEDGYIQDIKKVIVTIKSWNKPNRLSQIYYCFDSMTEQYGMNVIKDVEITHKKANSGEIKFGLCSDDCSVTILNSGRKFDRGYLKEQMQLKKRVIPYIGEQKQGAFYVNEWNISQDDMFIKCRASDRLLDFQDIPYEHLPALGEVKTAYELFKEMFDEANEYFVRSLDVKIDKGLEKILIPFPYIKKTNVWDAMQALCDATLSFVYIDFDEKMYVKSALLEYENNDNVSRHEKKGVTVLRKAVTTDTGNAFGIAIPFFADMVATSAEVKYFTVSEKHNEKLTTVEDINVVKSGTVTFTLDDLDFWTGNVKCIKKVNDDEEEAAVLFTKNSSGKTWTLTFGEPFVGKIEIYGTKVTLNENIFVKNAEENLRKSELSPYNHPATQLIRNNSLAERIAVYILSEYGKKTKCAVTKWRGNPELLPDKSYSLTDRFGDSAVYDCTSNKTVIDGGLKQDTKGVWRFDCKRLQG